MSLRLHQQGRRRATCARCSAGREHDLLISGNFPHYVIVVPSAAGEQFRPVVSKRSKRVTSEIGTSFVLWTALLQATLITVQPRGCRCKTLCFIMNEKTIIEMYNKVKMLKNHYSVAVGILGNIPVWPMQAFSLSHSAYCTIESRMREW